MEFLKGVKYTVLQNGDTHDFTGIEYDSRKIKEGNIFIALVGVHSDGHNFIESAINLGAKCILVSKKVDMQKGITYILVDDLFRNMGIIASNFYGWPQNRLKIIGITGTNGKTTTTYIVESLLLPKKCARIGTIEYRIGDEIIEAPNTTPQSLDIVKMCKKAVEHDIEYLLMEVSSHALSLGRVDILKFDTVEFTNLTQDHLDYHKNMENYFLAKRKLFTMVKDTQNCVVNIDDEYGVRLYKEFDGISYALKNSADIQGKILQFLPNGQEVAIDYFGEKYNVNMTLLGRYNLYNLLGAIGIAKTLGVKNIFEKLQSIKSAPGRFEIVDCNQDFVAVVDYAHTPDALKNILENIREIATNRVICVFGCGGDRDATKRPIMGEIASDLSDIAILTSDNPRTENATTIIEDVLKCNKDFIVEIDREKAIANAVKMAKKNDIILVAGKGHETYQILGTTKYHFDDREILRREIVRRKNEKNS